VHRRYSPIRIPVASSVMKQAHRFLGTNFRIFQKMAGVISGTRANSAAVGMRLTTARLKGVK
jgi:hypothetical protein